MTKSRVDQEADRELIPVKLPRWMHREAAQIGAETKETLGEVLERIAGKALRREHANRVTAKTGG